jgi:hypothetical protein
MSRKAGMRCHNWSRGYEERPGRTENERRVWHCRRCGVYARLCGQAWYLVWTEFHYGDVIVWPFALWTTARPLCGPARLVDPNGASHDGGHPTRADAFP